MRPLNLEIIEAVEKLVGSWNEKTRAVETLLPLRVRGPEKSKLIAEEVQLDDFIQEWLDQPQGPAVAILTGRLGGGKTVATWQLPERLRGRVYTSDGPGAVLWVPIRESGLLAKDPDDGIIDLLHQNAPFQHRPNLWSQAAGIKLVILDGLDEAFAAGRDRVQLIDWLNTLFLRVIQAPLQPRLLLSGRDIFLEEAVIDRFLLEKIQVACALRAPGHLALSQPTRFRMKSWDHNTLREILEVKLREKLRRDLGGRADSSKCIEDQVQDLTGLVAEGVLSAPILFGYAFEVLSGLALNCAEDPATEPVRPIETRWALTERWIELMLGRDSLLHEGHTPIEGRRHAAQEIALVLAISGAGLAGIGADELENLAEQPEHTAVDQHFRLAALARHPHLRDGNWFELKHGCLLCASEQKVAPFHQVVLDHLAAEALERLAPTRREVEPSARRPENGLQRFWFRLAEILGKPDLPKVHMLIEKIAGENEHLAQFDSLLREVIRYWARYCWRVPEAPEQALIRLELDDSSFEALRRAARLKRSWEVAFIFRNSLLDRLGRREDLIQGVPAILIESSLDSGELRGSAEILARELAITGPVVQGADRVSGSLLFLPRSSLQAARDLEAALARSRPLGPVSTVRAVFCRYWIERLFVDFPAGIRIEAGPFWSLVSLGSFVDDMLLREPDLIPVGSDPKRGRVIRWLDDRGPSIVLDPAQTFEDYLLCNDDVLEVAWDQAEASTDWHISWLTESRPTTATRMWQVIEKSDATTEAERRLLRYYSSAAAAEGDAVQALRRLEPLPEGTFPLWRRAPGGGRQGGLYAARPNVFLAEELVSVAEYAAFLRDTPHLRPPTVERVGWQGQGETVTFSAQAALLPVTGISRPEAQAYLDWLERQFRARTGYSDAWFRLPDPEELQLAALGTQLEEPLANGAGPSGHRDITGRRWQWTRANRGGEAITFGGSERLGSDIDGSAQKTLLTGWPDLSQPVSAEVGHDDVGFRVCVVDEGADRILDARRFEGSPARPAVARYESALEARRLEALAFAFANAEDARALLDELGLTLPPDGFEKSSTPEFWEGALRTLQASGRDLVNLLQTAADRFPQHAALREAAGLRGDKAGWWITGD